MTTLKNHIFDLVKIFHSVKDENLRWKQANQDQQIKLKQARVLAEKALEAELKKKSVQLEHEITLLKTKNSTELSMFKTKCKQDIKDYKQYLASLDQLKRSIQASYKHLPEAVAFTIHHHAKHLLNQMWEANDLEQKMRYEMQLIHFMTTVHEDACLHLENATAETFPKKTLSLIQQR
jgi:transposase-like protein